MQKSTDSSLASYWMPFTANRDFKQHPRMLVSAEGMYYKDIHGKPVLDATAGLWCVPLGHRQQKIVEAVQETVAIRIWPPGLPA